MPEVLLQATASNISQYLKILQIQINLQSTTLDTINRSTRTQKEAENAPIHQSERFKSANEGLGRQKSC